MSGTVLDKIARSVEARLAERKKAVPLEVLFAQAPKAAPSRDFASAFPAADVNLIAEVKFTSPALGKLADSGSRSPRDVAGAYLSAGAKAVSVLTEQDHFQGSPEFLREIRSAFPAARLLMKDFMLEEYQLYEARILGADAILLIVALLGEGTTARLLKTAHALGLAALVEVHDEEELEIASRVGARLIGVNNRNLKTLEVTLSTSHRLAPLAPREACLISESGISTAGEINALRAIGYRGFLVGTALMREASPEKGIARLIEGGKA